MTNYFKPKIIAEIGCNHQGDINIAKRLVKQAALSGADYVKFQKRSIKYLLGDKYYKKHPAPSNSFGVNYGKHREFLEFNIINHLDLYAECKKNQIKYAVSVWDKKSALTFLKSKIKLDYIKIPSASNLDFELLNVICEKFKRNIHISLGMTKEKETDKIFEFILKKKRNKDLVFYSCTSEYPSKVENVHLLEIINLKKKYLKYIKCIGFSGHHLGISLDTAAYTLGAEYIERHFTLDRTMKGTDHSASLEPQGLTKLSRNLNSLFKALTFRKDKFSILETNMRKKLKKINYLK